MAERATLTGVAPVLTVRDVVAAAAYWTEKVGFTEMQLFNSPPDFAIGSRDGLRIMLAQVGHQVSIVPHWKVKPQVWNAYFWTDDAATLYAELCERGAIIDYKLGMKPYGVLEFGIRDLEDHDIAFGQVVR